MNDLADCDCTPPSLLPPAPGDEFTSTNDLNTAVIYTNKISSARAQPTNSNGLNINKRNFCIISSQNNKIFPKDFFRIKEHSGYSGYFTERNVNSLHKNSIVDSIFNMDNNIKLDCEHANGIPNISPLPYSSATPQENKIVIDLQQEIDEDREILDMIKESTDDFKHNTKISFRSLSDSSAAALPFKFRGMKPSSFEMIPEEDEEKTRTENDTAKRFFKSKEDGTKEVNQLTLNVNTEKPKCNEMALKKNLRKLKIEINDKPKEEKNFQPPNDTVIPHSFNSIIPPSRIFSPKFKVTVVDQLNEITRTSSDKANCKAVSLNQKNSRERSVESPSTCEFTQDSAKNKKREKSPIDEKEEGFKIENFLKDSFKLKNTQNYSSFNKMLTKTGVNYDEDYTQFSSHFNEPYFESNATTGGSTQSKNMIHHNHAIPNTFKISLQRNFQKSTIKNPQGKNENKLLPNHSVQPEKNCTPLNQLPPVKAPHNPMYSNLARFAEKANISKEDPVIRKKLANILQNISEIRAVISQKSNKRMKVASAPSYCEERTAENLPLEGKSKKIIKFIEKKERNPVKVIRK